VTNKPTGGPAFPMQDQQAIHAYAQAKVELLSSSRADKPMSTNERDAEYIQARAEAIGGMTLRQYAAIALKVPDSGTDWLDHMIRQSLRDEFAGRAMDGFNRHMVAYEWGEDVEAKASRRAYEIADSMLRERYD
jgi:hypothetical protein